MAISVASTENDYDFDLLLKASGGSSLNEVIHDEKMQLSAIIGHVEVGSLAHQRHADTPVAVCTLAECVMASTKHGKH